ncbi:MAG: hypothetical protein RL238_3304 [Actinomycetota bacterium]|jgi:uncharacterized protein YndB with AHSA1/START domain
MTVTAVNRDHTALTLTVDATFDAARDRVWQLWADPRKLERWWGPPMFPATFVDHHLEPGGRCSYFMTSPDGDKYHGWWEVVAVDAGRSFEVRDGFSDGDGNPNPEMPVTKMQVELRDRGDGGTDVTITSTFATLEQLEQLVEMGMEEGLQLAMGQMDAILADA